MKWGDTGPRLLTRVLKESGALDRAAPAAVCYPIHYSQALDLLRPSETAVLAPRLELSLFLHVWNSMLVHLGVEKTCLPPPGSLLRRWADKHPVDGWIGEYDGHTLECALSVKAELNACAEEKRAVQAALEHRPRRRRSAAARPRSLRRPKPPNNLQRIQFDDILASTSWRMTAPICAGEPLPVRARACSGGAVDVIARIQLPGTLSRARARFVLNCRLLAAELVGLPIVEGQPQHAQPAVLVDLHLDEAARPRARICGHGDELAERLRSAP